MRSHTKAYIWLGISVALVFILMVLWLAIDIGLLVIISIILGLILVPPLFIAAIYARRKEQYRNLVLLC